MTEDSILKQSIAEINVSDFSNFYTQEVEIQYGAQVKSISKNEYYDTEQWLVNRIMFMYLYTWVVCMVRGQLARVGSLLPPSGSQGSNWLSGLAARPFPH